MLTDQRFLLPVIEMAPQRLIAKTMGACFLTLMTLATGQLTGCDKKAPFDPAVAGSFFPLKPGSSWTYRIVDKTEPATEIITDRVVSKEYIEAFKAVGDVVLEISQGSMSAAPRKIFYINEGGYLARLTVFDRLGVLPEERRFLRYGEVSHHDVQEYRRGEGWRPLRPAWRLDDAWRDQASDAAA